MVIRSLLALATSLPAIVPGLSAQELSPADTVSIVVASVEAHVEERWLAREARVWVRYPAGPNAYDPTPPVVEALLEVIPGLRVVPSDTTLYDCPDGGLPRFPLTSCPVREDGRVVTFGRLEVVDETTVELWVSIGTCCVLMGRELRLRRTEDGGWEFVEVVGTAIT